MRTIEKRPQLSRRQVLAAGGATIIAMSIAPGGMVIGKAWAAKPEAIKPETFATLVQMSRDIYPHDRFADALYANAVEGLDKAAQGDEALVKMLEDGVAALDASAKSAHNVAYKDVNWELQRVSLLRKIESGDFFQKVRGDLITGLYNQKDVWKILGYEGSSAEHGGYIDRGFNDIDWL